MQNLKTLQIATFGPDDYDSVVLGIRSFPIHKLALICYDYDKGKADDFARKIKGLLGIPITTSIIRQENVVRDTMEQVNELLVLNSKEVDQVLLNVSSGEKLLGCSALSAAFVNGIKAFGMDHTKTFPIMMPIIKLSYSEIISEAKIKILKAVEEAGGSVGSLEQLEHITGFGKPLLSYHVQGGRDIKGLASLGLLEVERKDRGKIASNITTLGKLLITSRSIKNGQ